MNNIEKIASAVNLLKKLHSEVTENPFTHIALATGAGGTGGYIHGNRKLRKEKIKAFKTHNGAMLLHARLVGRDPDLANFTRSVIDKYGSMRKIANPLKSIVRAMEDHPYTTMGIAAPASYLAAKQSHEKRTSQWKKINEKGRKITDAFSDRLRKFDPTSESYIKAVSNAVNR